MLQVSADDRRRLLVGLVALGDLVRVLPLNAGVSARDVRVDLERDVLRVLLHAPAAAVVPECAEPPAVRLTVETVEVWRCSRCGKWSHAKRRPRQHERRVELPAAGDVVLATDHGLDPDDGPRPYVIACGPFERWVAVRHG